VSTDGGLTRKRSSGSTGTSTGVRASNITAGAISSNDPDEISIDTVLESRRSRSTAERAGRGLPLTRDGVLDLQRSLEVVNDGRDKLVLPVRLGNRAKLTKVTISSKTAVTSKGSSFVIITIRVEIFFDILNFSFGLFFVIVGTLERFIKVLSPRSNSKGCYQ